jgi:transposase
MLKVSATLLTEGQLSDFKGAALMVDALPSAKALLGDKGYDANWFRNALAAQGIQACIPSKANRKEPIEYDKLLYRQRHKIRCADIFMGAITIAANGSAKARTAVSKLTPCFRRLLVAFGRVPLEPSFLTVLLLQNCMSMQG